MNIRELIRSHGYDLMEERVLGGRMEYDLRFNLEKRHEMKADDSNYDFDIDGIHPVYVDEVSFNGKGDLYVTLNLISDDSCWDVLE